MHSLTVPVLFPFVVWIQTGLSALLATSRLGGQTGGFTLVADQVNNLHYISHFETVLMPYKQYSLLSVLLLVVSVGRLVASRWWPRSSTTCATSPTSGLCTEGPSSQSCAPPASGSCCPSESPGHLPALWESLCHCVSACHCVTVSVCHCVTVSLCVCVSPLAHHQPASGNCCPSGSE